MNKKDIVNKLEEIGIYLELKGENAFKVAAYRKAAKGLEEDLRSLNQMDHFESIPGIGKGTAQVINELKTTGRSSLLEELKQQIPSGLLPVLKLPGLGGKRVAKLYQELQVTDLASLQIACEENRVQQLAGFGKKTEQNILEAIQEFGKSPDRSPLAYVIPIVAEIEKQLASIEEIEQFSVAGSYRRYEETVKDLDFIIATTDPNAVAKQLVDLDNVVSIIAEGETKVSVELKHDYILNIDFRLVQPEQFATALHHFTGSQHHNIMLRQLAKKQNEKISEYGVEQADGTTLTFENEKQFFQHFNLQYIPPELRAGEREIDRYKQDVELVQLKDIKGDLHMHSTWSDGAHSIEEMAHAARKKGYEYIAITDHSQFLKVANGLTPDQLKRQQEEIQRLNELFTDFTIFSGIEMDILPDGSLDYDDDLLAQTDFVIASIHSAFSQNKDKIMQRLGNALQNAHVDMIAHPTGRLVGRREGYAIDLEMLMDVAQETNTALELNSNPNRLDLSPVWLQKAQEKGVRLVINTDAHSQQMLDHMEIGVATARKGWIKKESVLNTFSSEDFQQFLNRNSTS